MAAALLRSLLLLQQLILATAAAPPAAAATCSTLGPATMQNATARSFGGDPDRVTVCGQSSGGSLVLALLASPASRGLLHGGATIALALLCWVVVIFSISFHLCFVSFQLHRVSFQLHRISFHITSPL